VGALGDAVMPLPTWLPPLIEVNPWGNETFDKLYAIFEADFKAKQPSIEGTAIWFFPETEDEKERIFWHLTHRDDKELGTRLPDLRRCERLCWVYVMIENCNHPDILFWDFLESDGSTHTYIWLRDHDFVVILKKYKDGRRRLVTSYFVDEPGKKKTFESKYNRRIKN
jgi:hypothetical protein